MDPASFVIAVIALLLSIVTFYYQFIKRNIGITITLVDASIQEGRITARYCITNTGDSPFVIMQFTPAFFTPETDPSYIHPGHNYLVSPEQPFLSNPYTHIIVTASTNIPFDQDMLFSKTPFLIHDSNKYPMYLCGGFNLAIIMSNGCHGSLSLPLHESGLGLPNFTTTNYVTQTVDVLKHRRFRMTRSQ